MNLPEWASQVLDRYKPEVEYRSDGPNAERMARWEAIGSRLKHRWHDLAPEKWTVLNDEDPRARDLQRAIDVPAGVYLRQCILECAIESAEEIGTGKKPADVVAAVKEIDQLNEKISDAADGLSKLFLQREQLQRDFHLTDRWRNEEAERPDEFAIAGALEMMLRQPRFSAATYRYQEGLKALYGALSSKRGERPVFSDFFQVLANRPPRRPEPYGAADLAVVGSKTNSTEWSRWGLRLIAHLEDWRIPGMPDGYLRKCLTYPQLATLAEVALGAPAGAYSSTQMGALVRAHRARSDP